jgi:hypothetical protein
MRIQEYIFIRSDEHTRPHLYVSDLGKQIRLKVENGRQVSMERDGLVKRDRNIFLQ